MKKLFTTFAALAALTPALFAGLQQNNLSEYDIVLRPSFKVEVIPASDIFSEPQPQGESFVLTPVTLIDFGGFPEGSRVWWVSNRGLFFGQLVVANSSGEVLTTVGFANPTAISGGQMIGINDIEENNFFGPGFTPLATSETSRSTKFTLNTFMSWQVDGIQMSTIFLQNSEVRNGRSTSYVRARSAGFVGDGNEGFFIGVEEEPREYPTNQLYIATRGSFSISGRASELYLIGKR